MKQTSEEFLVDSILKNNEKRSNPNKFEQPQNAQKLDILPPLYINEAQRAPGQQVQHV